MGSIKMDGMSRTKWAFAARSGIAIAILMLCFVDVAMAAYGSISASPQVCTLPEGSTCSSTISWSSNSPTAQVFIQPLNGSTLYSFASGQSGSIKFSNLSTYGHRFHLKAGTETLGTVDVIKDPSPTVGLTAPADGAAYMAPATIELTAVASDVGGGVNRVEFYNGSTKIGEDTTSPYSFTWSGVGIGSYAIKARAVDSRGTATDAPARSIVVHDAPSVSLTAPANGSSYTAPASITLTASASDSDGIAAVRFYSGSNLIGEDSTAPYSVVWSGVAGSAAAYSLKAQAIDNRGAMTESPAIGVTVNALPTVSLTAPSGGASYSAPATITLTASASDGDGSISSVEFYNGGALLATDSVAPYSVVWSNVGGSAGAYGLKARAIDNRGAIADSATTSITVNAVPVVSLTAPANGASYSAPASITLTANASDGDDGVSKVEFYNGSTLLATDMTSPYSYVWGSVAGSANTYSVKARVIDTRGAATDSATASITVNALPAVAVTAPTQNQVFQVGANVSITATASDADGSVQRVEFYVDGAKVGEDAASPYDYVWASAEGVHTVSAKAIDNRNAVTTSGNISVIINGKPTITLTAPTSGTTADPPATLQLSANASDFDGVASVEFFADGASINIDTTSPYAYTWSNVGSGVHAIYAVARDVQGGAATSATSSVTVSKIIGNIDGLNADGSGNYTVSGWACSTGLPSSVNVHLYVGGAAGTGTYIGAYAANVASEPAVANACSSTGTSYRFSIPLASTVRALHAGEKIYIHGISPIGRSNLTIGGSGQFAIPAMPSPLPVSTSYSRTEAITYHDDTDVWVIGQTAQVACTAAIPSSTLCDGDVISETDFDPTYALPVAQKAYGKPQQTLTYDTTSTVASGQLGTLKTIVDGNNNVTTLSGWSRGVPQARLYADGTSESAEVDNSGWITSVTDENGYMTCYGYDAVGRLASITYPSEAAAGVCDTSTWAKTIQVFEPVASAEYGIAAGHWRQTITTGNGRKVSYYDALWRPMVVREYDAANVAGTDRFQRFAYDEAGRIAFVSYPGTTDALATGTWTDYDALGRVIAVSQDSELGLLTTMTEYMAGFQTRVTDPKGYQTTTSYMTYDQPSADWPLAISHPEGAFTHISRDAHGKPTQIQRSDSASPTGGTLAISRAYAYNSNQELCRSVEPETGATLMGYDGAGNLKWSSAGLVSTTECEADGTSTAVAARRVDRAYDTRNRLRTLVFPDGKGNQSWNYAPDGLPASVLADNGGTDQVTTQYAYNHRRLLTEERMLWGGINWPIGYGYNTYGHLSGQTYPNGESVTYAPNALGQPTQVGAYATGVNYYPNGAIKQFTYGNGIVHTMAQNARQLPTRSIDCIVAGCTAAADKRLDLTYAFDTNANVNQITDNIDGRQTRGMAYDGLDRLRQVTSNMFGTATYAYDVLDNLTQVNVAGGSKARNYFYSYDGSWRLGNVKSGSPTGPTVIGLDYDVQGNLANKNGAIYNFDYGNRLRGVNGVASYVYDGLGRRVRDYTTASKYSLYSQGGQLMYASDVRLGIGTQYVYLGGSLVAFWENAGATVTLKYQHNDALGSPIAVTDAGKAFLEKTEYEPYGQVVNGTLKDGPGYTGHVLDAATGMNYMQQRYYDPMLGRMLSRDPVTAYSNGNMRFFNAYAYAFDNPYRFTDPDGRAPADGCGSEGWDCNRPARMNPFVSIGPIDVRPAFKPLNFSTKPGVTLSSDSYEKVSDTADNYFDKTGKRLVVTDGVRTPQDQAARMHYKITHGAGLREYRNRTAANEIMQSYRDAIANGTDAVSAMASTIQNQMDRGIYISRHLRGTGADFRDRDMSGQERSILRSSAFDAGAANVLREGIPPHTHVEY